MPQNGFFTLPFRPFHLPLSYRSHSYCFSAIMAMLNNPGSTRATRAVGNPQCVCRANCKSVWATTDGEIGPAPSPAPFAPLAYDGFGPPLVQPPAFPVVANPGNPDWVRRPTPFDGSAPTEVVLVHLR